MRKGQVKNTTNFTNKQDIYKLLRLFVKQLSYNEKGVTPGHRPVAHQQLSLSIQFEIGPPQDARRQPRPWHPPTQHRMPKQHCCRAPPSSD